MENVSKPRFRPFLCNIVFDEASNIKNLDVGARHAVPLLVLPTSFLKNECKLVFHLQVSAPCRAHEKEGQAFGPVPPRSPGKVAIDAPYTWSRCCRQSENRRYGRPNPGPIPGSRRGGRRMILH